MSLNNIEEIKCPCGNVFEAELWSAINVAEDPDLKEALKCGEINVVSCPLCGQMIYAEHFILYHDAESELLAFVYPSSFSAQAHHWEERMQADFERARTEMQPEDRIAYPPLLLFGLDALVSLIEQEEEENDEVMILDYMAKDLGLSVIPLAPAQARLRHLPRLLPSLTGGSMREKVETGLHRLLDHNEHLMHYRRLLETIHNDELWDLDHTLILQKTQKEEGFP